MIRINNKFGYIDREPSEREEKSSEKIDRYEFKKRFRQRKPLAHDTDRNPMFSGCDSGWASDMYYIVDTGKVKIRLNKY